MPGNNIQCYPMVDTDVEGRGVKWDSLIYTSYDKSIFLTFLSTKEQSHSSYISLQAGSITELYKLVRLVTTGDCFFHCIDTWLS